MLIDRHSVGIVSLHGDLIENLYVLPSDSVKVMVHNSWIFQIRSAKAFLACGFWDNNEGANRLYTKHGF